MQTPNQAPESNQERGLIAWWANNKVAANLLMLLIIITGLFMVFEVRKQMFPEIELNNISIQVPFPEQRHKKSNKAFWY